MDSWSVRTFVFFVIVSMLCRNVFLYSELQSMETKNIIIDTKNGIIVVNHQSLGSEYKCVTYN